VTRAGPEDVVRIRVQEQGSKSKSEAAGANLGPMMSRSTRHRDNRSGVHPPGDRQPATCRQAGSARGVRASAAAEQAAQRLGGDRLLTLWLALGPLKSNWGPQERCGRGWGLIVPWCTCGLT
jgi:hypothetical protein